MSTGTVEQEIAERTETDGDGFSHEGNEEHEEQAMQGRWAKHHRASNRAWVLLTLAPQTPLGVACL